MGNASSVQAAEQPARALPASTMARLREINERMGGAHVLSALLVEKLETNGLEANQLEYLAETIKVIIGSVHEDMELALSALSV